MRQQPDDVTDDDYTGSAVGALRRIAFLLERSRAETYKVKAFRAAADTILPLGDEVAARVRAGTLRELPGIGASTAEVIEAAVEGRTPERLARLERETGGPLVDGGEELRGRSAATCTRTATGPTAAPRSRRWRSPRWSSATSTSC